MRERRADYGQPLPSRPRNAPANTTRTPTLGPLKKADDAFRICNVLLSNPRPRRPDATPFQQTNPLYRLSANVLNPMLRIPLLPQAEMRILMVNLIVPEFVCVSICAYNTMSDLSHVAWRRQAAAEPSKPTTLLPST